jgi:type I restriction enzyme S subunit
MELKPGYTQTEVGAIPEDWSVDAFGKVYAEPSRNGIYKSAEYQGRGIRIVNMGEMFGLDFISDQEMNRISLTSKEIATTGLRDGDLLFGRRSVVPAGAGKCSIVITPPEPMTFESSIIRVRLNKTEVDPLFHYYFFASSLGRAVMSNIISGTNIKGIRGTELRELKIPRPPLPEQRSIATTLSDMDELLGALDRLIAKKHELKQAAMQQLLTGKTRLLEFDEEKGHKQTEVGIIPESWKIQTLDEISTISRLAGAEYTSFWLETVDGEIIALRGFNIGKGKIIERDLVRISNKLSLKLRRSRLCKGDVVYPCVGSIGNAVVITEDRKYHIQQNIAKITPEPHAINSYYLANFLMSTLAAKEVERFTSSSSQPSVLVGSLRQYRVPLPPTLDEQIAIATVLSDMDAEIAALEQRRDKTRALKQAMMQELLTGRTRLV